MSHLVDLNNTLPFGLINIDTAVGRFVLFRRLNKEGVTLDA